MVSHGLRASTVALLVFLVGAGVAAAAGPWVSLQADASTEPKVGAGLPELPNVELRLRRVVASDDPLGLATRTGFKVREGRIEIVIEAAPGKASGLVTWLEASGARAVSSAGDLVAASVDPEVLRVLAGHPDVVLVRRPHYLPDPPPGRARSEQAALVNVTEGAAAMNSPAWNSAGFAGQGVKVGVIDSQFGGWDSLLGTELPTADKTHYRGFGSATPEDGNVHGTGCAEVIHDVAPSAELYLAQTWNDVDFANAVDWMIANGVKVISMSMGWLSYGPGDGTGPWCDKVAQFTAQGGFWANSAGNSRLAHWQGVWRDDDSSSFLNFSSSSEINLVTSSGSPVWISGTAGATVSSSLIWNQWSSPATDLDFYLYKCDQSYNCAEVAKSDEEQSGQASQSPVEEIFFEIVEDGYYGFAVKLYGGPSTMEMEFFNRFDANPLQFNVQDGSITPPADAASAVAVAALDAQSPYTLEAYSSRGPTNGSGGRLSGGTTKPDIAGYANVSTASYGARGGGGGFSGTSAACPHVAGAAAVVWSAYGSYTASQVRQLLEARAMDMGTGGKDNDYGVGRLHLGSPPSAGCDPPGTPGNLHSSASSVSSGASYTISWNAASSADGYELQEATNVSFSSATSSAVTGTSSTRSHSVSVTTTYYYRVRATRSCGSSSSWSNTASVSVTGGGGGGSYSYWVPVVARLAGQAGSQFYSDVGVLNRSSSSASIELRYYRSGSVYTRSETVGGNDQRIFVDVVSLIGQSDKGSLEVRSNQPLTVTSRTYNKKPDGSTFGQFYDGYTTDQGLSSGQSAVVPQLTENPAYRCNIGLTNTGTSPATVTVTLFDSGGGQIAAYTVSLNPGESKQENQPFKNKAAQTDMGAGYAVVSVTAGSGVLAFGSVLDNVTSDPTTMPMKP